ncbi:hypothetical protein Q1695_005366 [Nippostrongylus brasiliensis]|nr:hypothetical protein Q1695_005366 [Nippostrongylus brasiliensis]
MPVRHALGGVADDARNLIKEIKRCPNILSSYDDETMRNCIVKMNELYSKNVECANKLRSEGRKANRLVETVLIARTEAIFFIRRCCLAYLRARSACVRSFRWKIGGILPPSVRNELCEAEIEFFDGYCGALAEFQQSLGENGVNLLLCTHPPKTNYIQVRIVKNYGRFETSDGYVVNLLLHSTHSLPRNDCELLIRQGFMELID